MKIFGAIFITVITSLFYFPFNTSILPTVNTKMALAVVGLLLFAYQSTQSRYATMDSTFMSVSVWAMFVSVVGLISIVINDTGDYTYASYIVSVWVWLGGAYVVIKCIDGFYEKPSLRILTNFLIIVCVAQCVLSQIIDSNISFAQWVDGFMVSTGFMGKAENRLYGIGCALDVAGLKFCVVLILLAYFAANPSGKINRYFETSFYVVAFSIICVYGAMISRTTTIGMLIAIIYWLAISVQNLIRDQFTGLKYLWTIIFVAIIIFLPTIFYMYHNDNDFYENLRFGFEGFFSLVEKGEWDVRSNEQLMGMWIFPENIKTWIIGDGYFNSPYSNPYYIGPYYGDYYMGTDIGYCRFIFYFGIIGLCTLSGFFINCARLCSNNIPSCGIMFWLILLVNFIGWCKVSSDVFPIYALILMLGEETNSQSEVHALSIR